MFAQGRFFMKQLMINKIDFNYFVPLLILH